MPPPPAGTGAIDAAIRAFASSMPLQSARVQLGALEQLLSLLSPSFRQQATAVDIALYVNVVCALLETLSVSGRGSTSKTADVEKYFQELFHVRVFNSRNRLVLTNELRNSFSVPT